MLFKFLDAHPSNDTRSSNRENMALMQNDQFFLFLSFGQHFVNLANMPLVSRHPMVNSRVARHTSPRIFLFVWLSNSDDLERTVRTHTLIRSSSQQNNTRYHPYSDSKFWKFYYFLWLNHHHLINQNVCDFENWKMLPSEN